MSVYNGEKYLRESIDSILNQTFTNFEFLVIDNSSTDSSRNIILSYNDPRIKLIENEKNIGQAESLNRGLEKAKGKYIARMDHDDISLPNRLECQLDVMEQNPNVGVCGTFGQLIDCNGENYKLKYNEKMMTENEDLKPQLLFRPCFIHPSVTIRLSLLKDHNIRYEEDAVRAQDYLLWYRLSSLCDFMNISHELLKYRIHEKQLSKGKRNDQFLSTSNIRKVIIEEFLGSEITEEEKIKHTRISFAQHGSNLSEVEEAENWLKFLMNHNEINRKYKRESLTKVLQNIWMLLCMNSSHLGMRLVLRYFSSTFWRFKTENLYQEMKLVFKCLIKYNVKLLAYDRSFQNQDLGLFE
jgi:glycosyltransferase involved in cell wall biosynthesis